MNGFAGRSYDRSASWYEREDPTSNGGGGGGSVSPRKVYSRAPFEDWRKPAGVGASGGGARWALKKCQTKRFLG